ncbi:MAG: hypothetical protein LLF94_10935 [Chlamydiales bacterium]|nr:hypothetical protein [Chlamydiales bacterium]
MRDTTHEMTVKMREMIQLKSPIERLKMGSSMYETSKRLITRAILENNPTISKLQFRREFFLKFYGNDFCNRDLEKILSYLEVKS